MPQLALKNDLWGTNETRWLLPQWRQQTVNWGTVLWELAPAEKDECSDMAVGLCKGARGTWWAKERLCFLSLSASGALAQTFCSRHSVPSLGKPLLLGDKDLEKWKELREMESTGRVWVHLCGRRMERGTTNEPQAGFADGPEATGGFQPAG